jgi:hypothetical protein
MQPEKLDELRVWILRARHDLLAAERLGVGVDGLPDVAVYHCQQPQRKRSRRF